MTTPLPRPLPLPPSRSPSSRSLGPPSPSAAPAPQLRPPTLGLPSPPATNSDTSAGSTRVRQKAVSEDMEVDDRREEGEEETTPKADGREWIDAEEGGREGKGKGVERSASVKERSQQTLHRMAALTRASSTSSISSSASSSRTPRTQTLSRARASTLTDAYDPLDSPSPAPTLPSRARVPISGSDTEREPLRLRAIPARSPGGASTSSSNGTNGHVDEDPTLIPGRTTRGYTAPRRPGPGLAVGEAEVGAGGTTRMKRSPRTRKELPVGFRRAADGAGENSNSPSTSGSASQSPSTPTLPPLPGTSTTGASSQLLSRTLSRMHQSDSPGPTTPRSASRPQSRPQSRTADPISEPRTTRVGTVGRTSSLRRPRDVNTTTTGTSTISRRTSVVSPTSASSTTPTSPPPPTPPLPHRSPARPRSLVGEGLRAAGIATRPGTRLSDPPLPPVPRGERRSADLADLRTPLTSRLAERERERAGNSLPRAVTSLEGSWRERERERERARIGRTEPPPVRTRTRTEYSGFADDSPVPIRPASVLDYARSPSPVSSSAHPSSSNAALGPEHVRLMWDALGSLSRVAGEGSEDGSGLGSGESRVAGGGRGVLGNARRAVAAVAGMGDGCRRGVQRGMERLVRAEVELGPGGEAGNGEGWKEEVRAWREMGREVDEVVRALTGLMLGVGRALREEQGVGRRSVEGWGGHRRYGGGSEGSGVGGSVSSVHTSGRDRERERELPPLPPLPPLRMSDPPPGSAVSPSVRLAQRRAQQQAHNHPQQPRYDEPPASASATQSYHPSLEYDTPSTISRHTSLRLPPRRPALPPSHPSDSTIPTSSIGGGGGRKVSTASTATVRASPAAAAPPPTPPPGPGRERPLKDRMLDFPALRAGAGQPSQPVLTPTTATAHGGAYDFSAGAFAPAHVVSPTLGGTRGRRGSVRESVMGMFAGAAGAGAAGTAEEERRGTVRRRESTVSRSESERSEDYGAVEDLDEDLGEEGEGAGAGAGRRWRGGRYFAR